MEIDASPELGARVAAAAAYARKRPKEMAGLLSMSYETFRRVVNGTRGLPKRELDLLCAHSNLPRAFFTIDFATIEARRPDPSFESRLEALEKKVAAARLEELADDLAALLRSAQAHDGEADPR